VELDDLREAGITRLRVHYSDLLGTTRAKVIPLELAEEVAEEGLNFCVAVFSIDHTGVMPDGTGQFALDMQVNGAYAPEWRVRYLVDLVTPPPGTVCQPDQTPFP